MECRFCGKKTRWNVILTKKPDPSKFAAVAGELFERFGKTRFTTYGEMRKSLEAPGAAVAERVSRSNAEQAVRIVETHGGRTELSLENDMEDSVPPPDKKGWAYALAGTAFLAAVVFLYQRRIPVAPAPETTVDFSAPAQSFAPPHEAPSAADSNTQIHLKTMVAATATLSGNDATGSAFFIHPSGYLITNHHVTGKMSSITVQTSDGRSRPGKLIRDDPYYDLALVKVDGGPYPTLPLGDATTLEQGETVWTIGAPHGLAFTVTKGIVSFVGRNVGGKAFIQADVAINPGNSGGAMINSRGEIVGINNFIISNAVGLNFAIPINYIYMGGSPITREILPATHDNYVMAQWRSWEKAKGSETAAAVGRSSSASSSAEFDSIVGEINALTADFENRKSGTDSRLSGLKAELAEAVNRYGNTSQTISSETAAGARVAALQQELLRLEISRADDTVAYTMQAETLLTRAQNAVPSGDPRRGAITAQIGELRDLRNSFQTEKRNKTEELKQVQEARY